MWGNMAGLVAAVTVASPWPQMKVDSKMADDTLNHAEMADLTLNALHLQASYQIDAMCEALHRAAKSPNVEALPYLVQSLALRINELNGAVAISLASDDGEVESFRQVVFGFETSECNASASIK